jgi:hypothetical protein
VLERVRHRSSAYMNNYADITHGGWALVPLTSRAGPSGAVRSDPASTGRRR